MPAPAPTPDLPEIDIQMIEGRPVIREAPERAVLPGRARVLLFRVSGIRGCLDKRTSERVYVLGLPGNRVVYRLAGRPETAEGAWVMERLA